MKISTDEPLIMPPIFEDSVPGRDRPGRVFRRGAAL